MFSPPKPKDSIQGTDDVKSSIGVELEFLVAIATPGQQLNIPTMVQSTNGAPLIFPSDFQQRGEATQSRIRETIARVVAQHRGTRIFGPDEEKQIATAVSVGGEVDGDLLHLRRYQDWTVGSDATVSLRPGDTENQEHMSEYDWKPIEVASPPLWATEDSWEEIRRVVEALREEYWIVTPRNAGMHVHYGHGKKYIPFGALRRIAAFLVAVDPIIVQLHPEHRRDNDFCLSNRLYSRVAHGLPAAVISQYLGAEYVEEAPEFPRARPRPEPVSRPTFQRTEGLVVPFRRGQLTGYTFNPETFLEIGYEVDPDDFGSADEPNPQPLEIPYAAREILRCLNAPTVANLSTHDPGDRPAYSFLNYTLDQYKRLTRSRGTLDLDSQPKRTIEFRQMAATMDPDEVVAHGKVVVRLCEFATEADLDELWKVILDCTVAEVDGTWYDVFDLLVELGLTPEARVLKHSVARFRGLGETVPEEVGKNEETSTAEEKAETRSGRPRWLSVIPGFR
ncbi:hypothetical protein ONZ43_g3359 [Nemania bipapillata]|uniref:Uncharacterized protein n=1 Tax=Nemania bipapillata TaxID=110536 RepID=A0ACC2IX94_9PEZI|nr:hypothetical protein ONZ43_g3359 [Nemania bipapillata]